MIEKLKDHVDQCGVGSITIMLNLMCEVDSALETNNVSNIQLLFNVYMNLLQLLLPTIREKTVREAIAECIKGCKKLQAEFHSGCTNLKSINQYFVKAFSDINSSFNPPKCKCKCNEN